MSRTLFLELMGNGGDSCCKEVMRGEEEYAGGS